jgi:hypothetical protein
LAGLSGVNVIAFDAMAYVPSPETIRTDDWQLLDVKGVVVAIPQSRRVEELIVALPAAVSLAIGNNDNTWSCGPAT